MSGLKIIFDVRRPPGDRLVQVVNDGDMGSNVVNFDTAVDEYEIFGGR